MKHYGDDFEIAYPLYDNDAFHCSTN